MTEAYPFPEDCTVQVHYVLGLDKYVFASISLGYEMLQEGMPVQVCTTGVY